MGSGPSRGWLLAAVLSSVLLIASAPFIGQLSAALRDAAGAHYATVLFSVVLGSTALAVGAALLVIRERRAARYGLLTAGLGVAASYAFVSRSGVADVDAAERFHFIEYGLVALLFYKAWRPHADRSVLLVPLLAGVLVGTLEEWLQWFIPSRVGEARDVLLNLIAVGAGLVFSLGLDPPVALTRPMSPQSRRAVGWFSAAAVVAFAGFFHSVHLGHEIVDAEAGVFRSRYDAFELARVDGERRERWRAHPPLTWARLSREDQYFSEAVAHIRRRNELWDAGHIAAARHENRILERHYAAVLDAPSYLSPHGHRWPAAQRAQAERDRSPGFIVYASDALPYTVYAWPPWALWLGVALLVASITRASRR